MVLKALVDTAGCCREFLAGHAQDIPRQTAPALLYLLHPCSRVRHSAVPDSRLPSKNLPATARCLTICGHPERNSLRLRAQGCSRLIKFELRTVCSSQRAFTSEWKSLNDRWRSIASVGGGISFQRPRLSGTAEERPRMARAFVGKRSHHPRAASYQASHRKKSISARAALEMKSGIKHA